MKQARENFRVFRDGKPIPGYYFTWDSYEACAMAAAHFGGRVERYNAVPHDRPNGAPGGPAPLGATIEAIEALPAGGEVPVRLGNDYVSTGVLLGLVEKGLVRKVAGNGDNYGHDRYYKS